MDTSVIAALIGLSGVALGALLSGFGYYLNSRRIRLQTTRNVLYFLLEIRHHLINSYRDATLITDSYISLCGNFFQKKSLGDKSQPSDKVRNLIEEHLKRVIEATGPKLGTDFISAYENSLTELSKDDPLLAHRLKGREKLSDIIKIQEQYSEDFMNIGLFNEAPKMTDIMTNQLDEISKSEIQNIVSEMDSDILLVAKKCGLSCWLECKSALQKRDLSTDIINSDELEKKLNNLFMKLVSTFESKDPS